MKVTILCGGFGTRIRDVADDIPKPMIQIGGKPILWHIMKFYASYGFDEFVLCTGYKNQVIKEYFMNYDRYFGDSRIRLGQPYSADLMSQHDESGWDITIADTGIETMTGGRLKRVAPYLKDEEYFFLTYGDGVSDVDLNKLLAFHKSHGKALTVTGVHPPGRFGELSTTDTGVVRGFNEKPQTSSGRISGGYFVCSRRIFDFLDGDDTLVLEQAPMKRLVAQGELMMYAHDGFWQCMDTYRDWSLLQSMISQNKAVWQRW